ncbi:membrane protein insertase YidC [Shouchella clausii]|uniref:Membrane protein insertase YidC n=1 Tax=Shouchella clausii TaxID=79880 RepID=A0A268S3J7_SHOCL|nr:membrane protein insertase YidC [Shouchella clausii]PAD41369.1 OxaA precursor [Bacillus sp. 7520-S]SPU17979.1 stage III sporulation protein J [Niallia circulans]AST95838.1 OxaA precursor [Shouchella clausii]MBU8595808.1 membrane protein insertase YidC [Shouchella clausii]MCM3548000.1 membrane protein insertase YidC [Shouchella clausii]
MNKKKVMLTLSVVMVAFVLAACNTNEPITAESTGFWNSFFVYPMSFLITFFSDLTGGHFGWGIIIVTILIRLLILPLALKSQKSTRAMQALRPEMQEIQEKMKKAQGNPEKQREVQAEMLSLYQKHGVNPAAGCLPALVQIPIVMALYFAIMRTEEIGVGPASAFLWFNLGSPDYILPVIAGITTFIQFKMSMSQMPANPLGEGMPNPMNIMLYIMPAMIVIAGITLPSALALYWVVGNLFMIVQTYFIIVRPNVTKEEVQKDKA